VQSSRDGIEANAKNKRAAIGNAIYQIRFASMTLQEFGQNVSQSGILTPEENVLFYDKLTGVEVASEVWNFSERRVNEKLFLRCSRFTSFSTFWFSGDIVEAVGVSFSHPVKIRGVRLLGAKGKEHDVKLEVFSQKIEKKFLAQEGISHNVSAGFDVMLPLSIRVEADTIVPVKATVRGGGSYCSASDAQVKKGKVKEVQANCITVKFFSVSYSGVYPNDKILIHQIIFSKM
jgi:BTB/POZ domain-containing protein 3/6